jgi:polysaccharide biosynthesis transport protein
VSWDETERDDYYAAEQQGGAIQDLLSDPLGIAQRRWIPMVTCAAIGLVVTMVTCSAWQPMYVASTTILITSQQISRDFVNAPVDADTLANVNAMVGSALATENLSKLIDNEHLFADEADDVERIDLVWKLRGRVVTEAMPSVSKHSNALVYQVSYESEDPEESSRVANALGALFVEESIRHRTAQATAAAEFLRGELARDEAALREQSRLVSEFRRNNRGTLPDELPTTLRKIDMLTAQRTSLTTQISAKEDRIASLAAGGNAATESETMVTELQRELARQTALYTDDHPNVIALKERIARMQETGQSMAQRGPTGRMIDLERRDIERMHGDIARIDAEVADLNLRVDATPGITEELDALAKKEKVLSEDYAISARKVEEATLAESLESAQQGGQVSVLDPASVPTAPDKPRWMIALGGLAVTVGLALGVAVLLELIDPVVVGAKQVAKLCDTPVLGSLPAVS